MRAEPCQGCTQHFVLDRLGRGGGGCARGGRRYAFQPRGTAERDRRRALSQRQTRYGGVAEKSVDTFDQLRRDVLDLDGEGGCDAQMQHPRATAAGQREALGRRIRRESGAGKVGPAGDQGGEMDAALFQHGAGQFREAAGDRAWRHGAGTSWGSTKG
jgi:hypothetical protein